MSVLVHRVQLHQVVADSLSVSDIAEDDADGEVLHWIPSMRSSDLLWFDESE
jgi:hypothetical protein